MGLFLRSVSTICVVAGLASCGGVDLGNEYATSCIIELQLPGGYEYPAGQITPTAVPVQGGTQAGADTLNACIRAKAAAAGQTISRAPAVQSIPETVTAQSSGTGTTTTYTYGTPPTPATATPAASSAADSTAVFGCAAGSSPFQGGTGYCVGQ